VFLSIFKWEHRKGWDVLLRAFLTEFNAREPVDLVILTHPYDGADPIKAYATFLYVFLIIFYSLTLLFLDRIRLLLLRSFVVMKK
jgi:hypothetical protein